MIIEKLQKLIELLIKEENISVTRIASVVGSDRRTINRILKSLSKLGLVEIKVLEMGERNYSSVSLTKEYKSLYIKSARKCDTRSTPDVSY